MELDNFNSHVSLVRLILHMDWTVKIGFMERVVRILFKIDNHLECFSPWTDLSIRRSNTSVRDV